MTGTGKPIKATRLTSDSGAAPGVPVANRSHPWQVIEDPSGDFTGRYFQLSDLQRSAEDFTWPNGIRFMHALTGECKIYRDGALQDE